jgi:hypothetical protein
MAGLGWKQWVRERLSQTDLQGYIQDQVVMVFASAAARLEELPAPSDGMVSYLLSTRTLEVYGPPLAGGASTWRSHSGREVERVRTYQRALGTGTDAYPSTSGLVVLLSGSWPAAPAGEWLVHSTLAVAGSAADLGGNLEVKAGTSPGTALAISQPNHRADVQLAVTTLTNVHEHTHGGGDLYASVAHSVGSGSATIFNATSKMMLQYLGPTL